MVEMDETLLPETRITIKKYAGDIPIHEGGGIGQYQKVLTKSSFSTLKDTKRMLIESYHSATKRKQTLDRS